jgi:LDH2 family malate/lactate/ureidoglycolate dehydrogenase
MTAIVSETGSYTPETNNVLAGALIGEFLSIESAEGDGGRVESAKGGEFMIAIDPARHSDAAGFLERGEKLIAAVLAQ